ncbi:MAG: histidinol-phosphate transaminase, partial [Nitrosarchaeum sp.]|nr:histidinol-phosphate transaminase [Nitrosarchaeum sp.]
MSQTWLEKRIKDLSLAGGYKKPELIQDSLKLDSNENYVIPKQFQQDILSTARKNSDVREYPLGRVEKLIQSISNFIGLPSNMIGVGNGSDQILDLILSNFASKKTKI